MNPFGKLEVVEAFKNRREPEAVHILADAFWHALLVMCSLGAIVAIGFNLWEFNDVGRVLAVQPSITVGSGEKLPFEKKDLQAVVDGFADRKARYDLYSAQLPTIADPSETKKGKASR